MGGVYVEVLKECAQFTLNNKMQVYSVILVCTLINSSRRDVIYCNLADLTLTTRQEDANVIYHID